MSRLKWIACLLCLAVIRPLSADDDISQTEMAIAAERYAEAETLLRQQIDVEPSNLEAQFKLARVLSWQQKFAQAESEYQALLALEPANADYFFGLGQVGVWRGDPRGVLTQIEAAENLQPGNPEIWRLHIQALADLDDTQSRWQAVMVQQQAAKLFPDLDWTMVDNSDVPQIADILESGEITFHKHLRDYQVELGANYDVLTNHKGFWRSEFITVEHQIAAQESVYAGYLQTERFSLSDEQFSLGAFYPLMPNVILNMEGNQSPYGSVLAKDSVMTSLQWTFTPAWSLTTGYRHSDYATGPLQQLFGTLERYYADFRAAYTFRATNEYYTTEYGQRFDFSYYYRDSSFVTISCNIGAEIGGFQGTVYNTQFLGLHGRHWLDADWALTWDLAVSKLGEAYSRDGVGVGIRRAF